MTTYIKEYLNSLRDLNRPIYYYPNPGNGGDSIIAAATFQLLKECAVNYTIFPWQAIQNKLNTRSSEPSNLSQAIILYGGGGNLVNNYHGAARKILEKYHDLVYKFVILPHTINTHEDLLARLGSNVEIICREEVSYKYVKAKALKANVLLMDDLGLSLNIEKLFQEKQLNYFSNSLKKIYYALMQDKRQYEFPSPKHLSSNDIDFFVKSFQKRLNTKEFEELNCFRTDSEKTDFELPKDNIDLSLSICYGTHNESVSYFTSRKIIEYIDLFHTVNTNRLHIAIPSALLGKRVRFFANNYYKCRAIYEYSLESRFPNVEWISNA
ncbi:hypothetical protein HNI00_12785 [Thermoleptolyngbya oregonensis NK1-22]|uniref:Polysaccharide pyruvyl transferase domain-containing protein n=1 Tax=Thermoleptolyngbya oregonensis NK1-22 TaxID=2547457 RepID=A0AA96Y8M9_9CYAN|nr:hypothetical protein HNI00_12785 [Thermoleptolyngbya oregonensis NK1-22]